MSFELAVSAAAVLAGAVASIAGFGIGSILTPLLAIDTGTRLAVAAVSVPHLLATAFRFFLVRRDLDREVLRTFGIASAAGGIAGAIGNSFAASRLLTVIFGMLLVFAGVSELTGLMRRVRLGRRMSWIAGGLSGLFGGLVGNQGGIRSAALLSYNLQRNALVATATATGLLVDFARMPVYFAIQWREMLAIWPLIAITSVGVIAGTLGGRRILSVIPEAAFRRLLGILIAVLGVRVLISAI